MEADLEESAPPGAFPEGEPERWVGRSETRTDIVSETPPSLLASAIESPILGRLAGELPPLGHWLFFLPSTPHSGIGPDGHPRRGGLMPPSPLPRRMWAGSRIAFLAPIRLGDRLTRRSTVVDVKCKQGRSGALMFTTLRHEISTTEGPAICEHQDVVYSEAAAPGGEPAVLHPPVLPNPDWQRIVTPDPVLLFRFSALTFNGHRIHYDRDYARSAEGYPGLVVHGPLTATLLLDFFRRAEPQARVTGFSFRGRRPLTDTRPFTLSGKMQAGGAELAAIDADCQVAMTATVEVAP